MPRIFIGMEAPIVCWQEVIPGQESELRPKFKRAKDAKVQSWTVGDEGDGTLVAELLSLWTEVTRNVVEAESHWKVVRLNALNYGDVTCIAEMLSDREKDKWLLDRYRDSMDLLDFADLGRPGMLLMAMLELAKRRSGFDEAVAVLCRRVSSLMLKRPGCVLDEYLWRVEAGIARSP